MSSLFISTHIEALAVKLAENIEADSRHRDIFLPHTIIVPNRNVMKWLQIRLARILDVAINLDFHYLEDGLWGALCRFDPDQKANLLSHEQLRMRIAAILMDGSLIRKPEYRPFREYLPEKSNDSHNRNYYRKVWQLSDRLAKHLCEYEWTREKLVQSWQKGKPQLAKSSYGEIEAAQMALYRELFPPRNKSKSDAPTLFEAESNQHLELWKTLPQFARQIFDSRPNPQPSGSIHLFGTSQISPARVQIIGKLGELREFNVYHLNALGHAVSNENLAAVCARKTNITQNLPLQWSEAGRKTLKMLSPLVVRHRFELKPVSNKSDRQQETLLCALQKKLLEPRSQVSRVSQDTSLQILACPGVVREVETVYNSILANLAADQSLKLTDIGVLVTDMQVYRSAIISVFERQPQLISYNLTDFSAADSSVYGQALMGLLELALGSFTRSAVFKVILNPCFIARAGVSREDVLVWRQWAEALNICHSIDENDKQQRGYSANDLYTWRQGLRRLRLGRIMEADDGGSIVTRAYKNLVPYTDIAATDADLLSTFSDCISRLQTKLSAIANLSGSCADWRKALIELCTEFLDIPEDRPEEEGVRRSLFNALNQFSNFDQLLQDFSGLRLPLVLEFVGENLKGINSSIGAYLSGGITVSALQPMRPIPFKVLYILGLGEGALPERDNESSLDLRRAWEEDCDITLREANQYLLLESVASTSEKIYLSYVSKELQRVQELQPGSLLIALKRYLQTEVTGAEFKEAEIPLQGSSTAYFSSGAERKWCDALVNFSRADRLLALLNQSTQKHLKLTQSQLKNMLEEELRLRADFSIHTAKQRAASDSVFISTRELKAFLRNPIEGSLSRHLGLRDQNEPAAPEHEPFYATPRIGREIINATLTQFLISAKARGASNALKDWQHIFNDVYAGFQLRCQTPDGAFEQVDRERICDLIRERIDDAADFISRVDKSILHQSLVLGESRSAEATRSLPPLVLEADTKGTAKVTLTGSAALVFEGKDALDLFLISHRKLKESFEEIHLSPILFHLALSAIAAEKGSKCKLGELPLRIHINSVNESTSDSVCKIEPQAAAEYVRKLTSEFLNSDSYDVLPLTVISESKYLRRAFTDEKVDDAFKARFRDALLEEIESDSESMFSKYQPSELLQIAGGNVPDDAYDKVRRRFEILAKALEKLK